MNASPSRRSAACDIALRLLAVLGLLIAILGAAMDILPGASPGLNLPQLIMIAAGIALALLGYGLRRFGFRQALKRNLAASMAVSIATLLVLEAALALGGYKTYYAVSPARDAQEFIPWRTCDESGCHFIRDVVLESCNENSARRMCTLNPQGFADSQPFVAADDQADGMRYLILGDSFTFGMSSDIGQSFVETIESMDSDGIYWNTAVPGSGTHTALASFKVYAPLLRPQAAILGFYMNDFENNMISLSYWFAEEDPEDKTVVVWTDLWGNAIQLDQRLAFHYREAGIDPPANTVEHILGTTRLGSLALRILDSIARIKTDADGLNSVLFKTTRRHLAELRDAASAHDISLLVLLIPRRSDIGSPGPLYDNAVQLLQELGMDSLNPIHELDAQLDYAEDGHWNNAGHHKIAVLLSDCLDAYKDKGSFANCGV